MTGLKLYVSTLCMHYLQLTVLQGDIVKVTADALVHPTSNSFYLGGEVGQALQKAGGKDFQNEVKALHTSNGDLDTASGENMLLCNFRVQA